MTDLLAQIYFIVGFIIALKGVHAPERKVLLQHQTLYSTLYAMAFFMVGSLAGAASCLICTINALLNGFTKEQNLAKTFKYRLMIALILCVILACYTVQQPYDLIPFISLTMARVAETLHSKKIMCRIFTVSCATWTSYIFLTGSILWGMLEIIRTANCYLASKRHSKNENVLKESPVTIINAVKA